MPSHQVFTWPNRIDDSAWQGWVQERGLYFLGDKDPKYVDLVEMEDPFPYNSGAKRGALVEARHGKGRWVYVGLGLWRQLPAGTDGAYKLMANLVSLGKHQVSENPKRQDGQSLTTSEDPKRPKVASNCERVVPSFVNLGAFGLVWRFGAWNFDLIYFSNRIFPRNNMSSVSLSSLALAADSTRPPASRTPLKRRASMSKATK